MDESGKQEGNGLSGTSLGNTNDIKTTQCGGPALTLDGTGLLELASELFKDVGREVGFFETEDGSWGKSTSDDDLVFITEIINFFLRLVLDGIKLSVEVLLERRQIHLAPVDFGEGATSNRVLVSSIVGKVGTRVIAVEAGAGARREVGAWSCAVTAVTIRITLSLLIVVTIAASVVVEGASVITSRSLRVISRSVRVVSVISVVSISVVALVIGTERRRSRV